MLTEFSSNVFQRFGYVLHIVHTCDACYHEMTWTSSKLVKAPRLYKINAAMPLATVLSANQFSKVKRLFDALSIQCMSQKCHHENLKKNGYPAVRMMSTAVQQCIVEFLRCRGLPLILKGDGQSCTPGTKSHPKHTFCLCILFHNFSKFA